MITIWMPPLIKSYVPDLQLFPFIITSAYYRRKEDDPFHPNYARTSEDTHEISVLSENAWGAAEHLYNSCWVFSDNKQTP